MFDGILLKLHSSAIRTSSIDCPLSTPTHRPTTALAASQVYRRSTSAGRRFLRPSGSRGRRAHGSSDRRHFDLVIDRVPFAEEALVASCS